MRTIGLIGNPNCGKTTIFNALTGAKQHIGNWPGVTVEKKEGYAVLPQLQGSKFEVRGSNPEPGTRNPEPGTSDARVKIVDLPGIYSLTATSEDERASLEYVLSQEADLYINVVDATTIERNLYLTMLLCEFQVPMVLVVTMMDIARQRHYVIELEHLAEHLGVPVIGVDATNPKDVKRLFGLLAEVLPAAKVPTVKLDYGNELEEEIDILSSAVIKTAEAMHVSRRWVATRALEGDPLVRRNLERYHDMAPEVLDARVARVTEILADPPDVELAEARYGIIAGLVHDVVKYVPNKTYVSEWIDKVAINRFLGVPVFLAIMYLVFWFTQVVGGAFIDFFDIAGDTIFVSGMRELMTFLHAPEWLTVIVANGGGTALQTCATFLPPVGFMFLVLAILEDSGYMARAAFVMDRFMRWIGLPGKSFVPMLVGFGCSVPAIMATRTLESKRDRFLTIFMVPFMSCGAKLPIWTLFAAAFFPHNPGRLIFAIYLTGIVLGVVTGLILKHTLFQGEPTHFIMELPPYHVPRPKHILLHTWERLKIFIWRAGKFILPLILCLGVADKIGVLEPAGKAITPIFEPIGVEKENWPASVAVFTGLFAKESVIGTMKGLYGVEDTPEDPAAEKAEYSFIGGMKKAFASIPENLGGIWAGFAHPLGDGTSEAEAAVGSKAANSLKSHFSKGTHQMFAFLLFVLLYVPCIAATGCVFSEVGKLYGSIFVGYLTLLGWSVATIYHAVMVSQSGAWLAVGVSILAAMYGGFWLFGRHHRIDMV